MFKKFKERRNTTSLKGRAEEAEAEKNAAECYMSVRERLPRADTCFKCGAPLWSDACVGCRQQARNDYSPVLLQGSDPLPSPEGRGAPLAQAGWSNTYGDVVSSRPPEFSDPLSVDLCALPSNGLHDYLCYYKIGRGKYCEVYGAVKQATNRYCAVKLLKPIDAVRVSREILVLKHLCGGPNIITLCDVVRGRAEFDDGRPKTIGLVFEYIHNSDFRQAYPDMIDSDVRWFLYQVLLALEFCHANGVMHRDIKPTNIMLDPAKRQVRLIDFGLAEFYRPGTCYSVNVSTLWYRPPELLLGMGEYHYSGDLWSVGCVLAGIIFDIEYFFMGHDMTDQLPVVCSVLGTADLHAYIEKYKIAPSANAFVGTCARCPWSSFVGSRNRDRAHARSLELLDKMLVYDHQNRITAAEALLHPYFADLSDEDRVPR